MNSPIKFPLGVTAAALLLATSCTSMAETSGASINEQRKIRPVSAGNTQTDALGNLIRTKELTIEQSTTIRPANTHHYPNQPNYNTGFGEQNYSFTQWLNSASYRAGDVGQYQRYLAGYVGSNSVPPLDQLLTTARSWEKCGYEQYQLPPRELWSNMIPTLRLYDQLKKQGVIPATAEIRSTYRSPGLNACAGGAGASKHMTNGAIDIWVPEYESQPWYKSGMQDKLCQFWSSQGEAYNFGLGLYSTGAIHLDTQGYRTWGAQYSDPNSYCRYIN